MKLEIDRGELGLLQAGVRVLRLGYEEYEERYPQDRIWKRLVDRVEALVTRLDKLEGEGCAVGGSEEGGGPCDDRS